jgi:hypothetical protein
MNALKLVIASTSAAQAHATARVMGIRWLAAGMFAW